MRAGTSSKALGLPRAWPRTHSGAGGSCTVTGCIYTSSPEYLGGKQGVPNRTSAQFPGFQMFSFMAVTTEAPRFWFWRLRPLSAFPPSCSDRLAGELWFPSLPRGAEGLPLGPAVVEATSPRMEGAVPALLLDPLPHTSVLFPGHGSELLFAGHSVIHTQYK